jgi:hypothetical protein
VCFDLFRETWSSILVGFCCEDVLGAWSHSGQLLVRPWRCLAPNMRAACIPLHWSP